MTNSNDPLRDLARDLPWDKPSDARRDAVRSSLLVEAAEGADGRIGDGRAQAGAGRLGNGRRWLTIGGAFTAGALAAAAIAVLLLRRDRPGLDPIDLPVSSQISASSEAKLEHRMVATDTGVDEIVEVHTGKVTLAVPPVRRGDHVRVRTTTADVEGDAGELEVVVVADALQSVTVRTGSARITTAGQAPVFLAAGQTWHSAVITADLSDPTHAKAVASAPGKPESDTEAPHVDAVPDRVEPARTPARVEPARVEPARTPARVEPARVEPARVEPRIEPRVEPRVEPSKSTAESPKPSNEPSPDRSKLAAVEKQFQQGWALLRDGKAREAAAILGAAADAMPETPLAQDARYFQAVALVRAGDVAAAEKVLVQFLDHAPKSLRRGRAAVLLGRVLAMRGDRGSARAWFESAVTDPDPAIAAAARAGLQSLAAK